VFEDVSPDYVYQRNLVNLPRGTLAGKKIALVGCGAIGGYLASALLRLGAGTGGGTLHLQDIDELQPDNLGRHRLGYNSLFDNKAIALKKVLDRESPFANITISEKSVVDHFPQGFDLVINATGEQAVSEALNVQHVQASKRTPLLHVWVFGNGDCVQGLWVDSRKYACYRCLTHNDEAQYGQSRFPLTDTDTLRAFVGCHAFTPYGVSSPMSAATLAMDFVADWLKGDVSPRFRLRYNEGSTLRRFKSQNVSPLQGCPACQPQ
jgi:molybdopterin/thiamine biosynthesis adenylyltransferase